jgi:uncharacterized membrane protein
MNFMQLLQSLDDLLYEVMSWLVFFPITLWRTLTRPLRMMDYADSELGERRAEQYTDTLSPPLFLLLALLLAHLIGLATGEGTNPIVARTTGFAGYIDSDGKLLLLRLALFSIIPLMLASTLLVAQRRPFTRERLRAPFYAQCYPAGAFALALAASTLLYHRLPAVGHAAGYAVAVAACGSYGVVQVAWFRGHLRCRLPVALAASAAAIVIGGAVAFLVAWLFV